MLRAPVAPVAQDGPEIAAITHQFRLAITGRSEPFVDGLGGAAFELGGPSAADLLCELVGVELLG